MIGHPAAKAEAAAKRADYYLFVVLLLVGTAQLALSDARRNAREALERERATAARALLAEQELERRPRFAAPASGPAQDLDDEERAES